MDSEASPELKDESTVDVAHIAAKGHSLEHAGRGEHE